MGCGASTPSPPPSQGAAVSKAVPAAVELLLVLGLDDVSGKGELCASLCKQLSASGRHCQHLEVQALIKAEVSSETELGSEISALVGQGKIVPQSLSARVVRSALKDAAAGVYLLEGYPSSEAALKSMIDDVGHAPRLALLMELEEAKAKEKLLASGLDEAAANTKLGAFKLHATGTLAELERRSILHKLDATAEPDTTLLSARALVDSITRGTAEGGSSGADLAGRMVLVMGGPGSGKATLCARLASKYGCVHLSIEKLMRSEVREETETGRAIAEMVKGGKIVPAHLHLSLLKKAMAKQPNAACLIDGFPRSVDNLALLEEHIGSCKHALLLEASDNLLEQRMIAKGQEAGKQEDQEGVRRRIRTYKSQTVPALAALQARGVVNKIDASGRPDVVFKKMCTSYEKMGIK